MRDSAELAASSEGACAEPSADPNMVDFRQDMTRQVKIIVEKHADGYVAYPIGLKGVVVGEGDTYEEALADVRSAIRFHLETFGNEVLPGDSPLLEAFVAEATIPA
jgi:predicted RNase H-like HicB family nuclease